MRLLLRFGLLGLHTAWGLNAGAVEARSDPPNETTTSDRTPPPVARRQTGSSFRLSQQRERVGHVADGLVNGDWERGKDEEEEKEIEEGGAAWVGGKEHQVPSEYRALSQSPLLRGPVAEEEPAIRDTPYVSRLKSIAFRANTTEDYALEWKGAGGEFGMSADWREAISMPDGEGHDGGGRTSLRGEACMTQDKQAEVRAILDKRRTATTKVAVCVRVKDFGRFLPEWIAFHYAAGVDQITVYDDDSVDNTKEILQPFVEAGIVRYISQTIPYQNLEMQPLNQCLDHHLARRKRAGGEDHPKWVTFQDADEYLFPVDTDLTILQALERHDDICCLLVRRLQFGSGGHDETPRGLMLEDFLMHNYPSLRYQNGLAKVVVNLDPAEPRLGTIRLPLKSPHMIRGCECHGVGVNGIEDLRINHYLGSIGDFMDRTVRYWKNMGGAAGLTTEETVLRRDTNHLRSDEILHWACATREVLYRIVEGLDLEGEALGAG